MKNGLKIYQKEIFKNYKHAIRSKFSRVGKLYAAHYQFKQRTKQKNYSPSTRTKQPIISQ
tara:strand:+ start:323 stop:502 length:180 start_codon:yes stop_codon:yes gene_type:complete